MWDTLGVGVLEIDGVGVLEIDGVVVGDVEGWVPVAVLALSPPPKSSSEPPTTTTMMTTTIIARLNQYAPGGNVPTGCSKDPTGAA